ncbi:hypothetical protein C5167_011672 [Papaver somniferum]|uniref:Uncharacterized protein n=1 Tax=Papaver somniferum TaxID=3469 RepID=A0A4Y7K702_PAPSO|nr:hypothetical protein C5167_011672 [Papaver somniferum]
MILKQHSREKGKQVINVKLMTRDSAVWCANGLGCGFSSRAKHIKVYRTQRERKEIS